MINVNAYSRTCIGYLITGYGYVVSGTIRTVETMLKFYQCFQNCSLRGNFGLHGFVSERIEVFLFLFLIFIYLFGCTRS